MRIETIDTIEGFHALEPEWNRLLPQSDTDNPFFTFEWIAAWWKVYGGAGRMMVLRVKDGDETVAIVPLRQVRKWWRGMPVRAVALVADDDVYRAGIVLGRNDPSIVECILRHLGERPHAYDMLVFDRLVHGSLSHAAITAGLRAAGIPHAELKGDQSPYVRIQGGWDDYLRTRSRNLRSKLKLAANQFKRGGGFEITRFPGGDLDAVMDDVFAVSRKTWKFREGTALASTPERMRFYRLASRGLAARGWLNVRILRVGGKPVTFAYNIDYKGTSYFVKTGFDEDYRHLSSTGEFLNILALKESFEAGFREYDLMGKDEPYKMRLTSLRRDHRKILAFSSSAYGRFLSKVQSDVVPFLKGFARPGQAAARPGMGA